MTKTVAFFHRLELTDLFGAVSRHFPSDIRTLHIAYSHLEAKELSKQGIKSDVIFKDELHKIVSELQFECHSISELDKIIKEQTKGKFTLNSAIQSDRSFSILSYKECLILSLSYWKFWSKIIDDYKIDFIIHEPVSLMMNFIAAMAVAERKGSYLYCIMSRGLDSEYCFIVMSGFELYSPDIIRALRFDGQSAHLSKYEKNDLERFLTDFRNDISNFQGGVVPQSISIPWLFLKSLYTKIKNLYSRIGKNYIIDCIEYWGSRQNSSAEKLHNLINYRRFVRFEQPKIDETYWFYPLHLEPEAVVLYQAHGIYANQIKLIENIAAQLPPGHFLYVKDHPHDLGYRAAADYIRLNLIPNIRLLPANIPGKAIIRDAYGVITITGTAGFEAMLMGKPVVVFGHTFYSQGPGVMYVHNIRELNATIVKIQAKHAVDERALLEFLDAYFYSLHSGMTDFFVGRAAKTGLDLAENAKTVAGGLVATIQRL
jgi:hypothetical protein